MFTHTAWSANRACLIYAVHIINNVRCTQPHVLMYVSISPGSKMTLTGPVHAVVPLACSVGSGEGERLVVGIMHVNFHAGGML
ncbi:hypothetical protein HBI56_027630 [Parastagonospora nodorum]|nr:hypothetical protein HBH99_092890 [Parastagonospora nodorum]KAH5322894.1 hypothetical protein HBI11_036410 [Parastagonospora nodorum]KAH5549897.1 hypothetical protein HBI27_022720 [Parastagonospora nodorum]KAH6535597.1 hypothetical protein HBI81_070620 [Parastagonospora nodorum]KAH6545022.1 hypothetical protein HBI56_027630 [Parastagonospora nodorum]